MIFPGVGEASSAMKSLKENQLDQVIKELKAAGIGNLCWYAIVVQLF